MGETRYMVTLTTGTTWPMRKHVMGVFEMWQAAHDYAAAVNADMDRMGLATGPGWYGPWEVEAGGAHALIDEVPSEPAFLARVTR